MSVENTTSKVIYQGNGVAVEWPVPFAYSRADDIHLLHTDANGVETEIASNFRLNVNASGDSSVTYPVAGEPLPPGVRLTVYRKTPQTQIVDLQYGGAFSPETLENDGFDRVVMMVQEAREELDRAVKVKLSASESPDDLRDALFAARDQAQAASAAAGQSAAEAVASATRAASEADRTRSEGEAQVAAIRNEGAEQVNTVRAEGATQTQAAAEEAAKAANSASAATAQADRAKAEADRAQSLVEVGPATAEKLGMVKVGTGIAVTEDGTISTEKITTGATLQTDEHGLLNVGPHAFENPEICGKGDFQKYGHTRLTDNPDENAGAVAGMAASPVALRTAVARILDVSEDVTITTSGTYAVPFTGAYSITAVGGGGNGGKDSGSPYGGRGGGGGAGQVSTISRHLTKGQKIPIVIGGSGGGQTSVGDFLTAAGGGNGGDGQPGNFNPWNGTGNMGAPGAAGFSYGTPASPGGSLGTAAPGGTSAFPPYGNGGNGGTLISAPSNVLPPTPGTSGCVRITLTKLGG